MKTKATIQNGQVDLNLKDLLSQKFQLQKQLLLSKGFKLIDMPVKSKKPIILMLFFASFIVGIFCAFLVESWEKSKLNS